MLVNQQQYDAWQLDWYIPLVCFFAAQPLCACAGGFACAAAALVVDYSGVDGGHRHRQEHRLRAGAVQQQHGDLRQQLPVLLRSSTANSVFTLTLDGDCRLNTVEVLAVMTKKQHTIFSYARPHHGHSGTMDFLRSFSFIADHVITRWGQQGHVLQPLQHGQQQLDQPAPER